MVILLTQNRKDPEEQQVFSDLWGLAPLHAAELPPKTIKQLKRLESSSLRFGCACIVNGIGNVVNTNKH